MRSRRHAGHMASSSVAGPKPGGGSRQSGVRVTADAGLDNDSPKGEEMASSSEVARRSGHHVSFSQSRRHSGQAQQQRPVQLGPLQRHGGARPGPFSHSSDSGAQQRHHSGLGDSIGHEFQSAVLQPLSHASEGADLDASQPGMRDEIGAGTASSVARRLQPRAASKGGATQDEDDIHHSGSSMGGVPAPSVGVHGRQLEGEQQSGRSSGPGPGPTLGHKARSGGSGARRGGADWTGTTDAFVLHSAAGRGPETHGAGAGAGRSASASAGAGHRQPEGGFSQSSLSMSSGLTLDRGIYSSG